MSIFLKILRSIVALTCLLPATVRAQEIPQIETYDFTQFIQNDGPGPENIAELDSNWAILYLCSKEEGMTVGQLKAAGVVQSDSQITLLELMHMIKEDGDNYYHTMIPIFSAMETGELRALAKERSAEIINAIEPQVRAIMKTLAERGLEESAFSLLFS